MKEKKHKRVIERDTGISFKLPAELLRFLNTGMIFEFSDGKQIFEIRKVN